MTDHRVTDLSYGHLGKASYDTEENQWTFSSPKDQDQRIQPLLPLTERIPPSFQDAPKRDGIPSQVAKSQSKWLSKARPETFPANTITSALAKVHGVSQIELSRSGSLLTVGRAVDVDRVSRSRRPRILCMPCGGAGHILQLIRPSTERHGWGKHSVVKLSLLELEPSERGYWVGTGGAIRQIESADDENKSGTWLAVRQDTIITIFRPLYGKFHNSAGLPSGFGPANTSSRLSPNPVATLTSERTKSEDFMDVSFNPWYARQFAVVDARGRWYIWDLEHQDGKGSPEHLVSGNEGNFYNSYALDPASKAASNDHADGWYRILWACNINTLVVCNRRRIAVIDIKSAPVSLSSAEILTGNSTEWMLDTKRSPEHLNHLFVLTTSRIFWLEIVPPGEDRGDRNASPGIKVILSFRHFRDPNDETLRLTPIHNDLVTVFVSSAKGLLVNYYCFGVNTNAPGLGTSFQGSFTLASDMSKLDNRHLSLTTLSVVPASLTSTSNISSVGSEFRYLEEDVRFFQLWALTADLALNVTLLAALKSNFGSVSWPRLSITAPTIKLTQSLRTKGPRLVKDAFIVADRLIDERSIGHEQDFFDNQVHSIPDQDRDDLRFRLDWKVIFQHVFGLSHVQSENIVDEDVESSGDGRERLKESLHRAYSHVQQGVREQTLKCSTLHEISGVSGHSGDIEQATSILREFLDRVRQVQVPEDSSTFRFVLSDLTASPAIQFPLDPTSNHPDPKIIYNQLIDNWMASLPGNVLGKLRYPKFNIIRQTVVELFLSSFAVSLQNKTVDPNIEPIRNGEDDPFLPEPETEYGTTRENQLANFPSQLAAFPESRPDFSLPTPAQTPSLYSHATSASELKEDPAVSRLRQYAISIKSQPDSGNSPILSKWPSTPGSNPADYSWEAKQKAVDEEQTRAEREKQNRKEEARRRRRTERFLNQESTVAAASSTQPMVVIPSGSQPMFAHNGLSSQTAEDIPMTQPDRGAFGSRPVQKIKKKLKKTRTAGFR
ncbi:hypothetical protein N431DRAFT_402951 [Stipitochalara longipes BDJ]|nr:hypothetical protein N431DRAFT_402951 [Stipitochalara longipes BDJ]